MNYLFNFEPLSSLGDIESFLAGSEIFSESLAESHAQSSGSGEYEMIPELNQGNILFQEDDLTNGSIEDFQSPLLQRVCSNIHQNELYYASMHYQNLGRSAAATM